MSYASANSEVLAYTGFATVYSSSSTPTLAQVTDIIEQIEGEIDTTLSGLGLTVPATNATLIDYIRKQSAMGSAGLTLQRYGKNDNDFRLADWFYGKYEAWIDKLITDKNYQANIKEIAGTNKVGVYVGSNFTDGTHFESTPKTSSIQYGVDGFK